MILSEGETQSGSIHSGNRYPSRVFRIHTGTSPNNSNRGYNNTADVASQLPGNSKKVRCLIGFPGTRSVSNMLHDSWAILSKATRIESHNRPMKQDQLKLSSRCNQSNNVTDMTNVGIASLSSPIAEDALWRGIGPLALAAPNFHAPMLHFSFERLRFTLDQSWTYLAPRGSPWLVLYVLVLQIQFSQIPEVLLPTRIVSILYRHWQDFRPPSIHDAQCKSLPEVPLHHLQLQQR